MEESLELSRNGLTPHSIDLSARALRALGRDDTLVAVVGPRSKRAGAVEMRGAERKFRIPNSEMAMERKFLIPHSSFLIRLGWVGGKSEIPNPNSEFAAG